MAPTPPANSDDPGKDGSDQDIANIDTPQYIINAGSSSESENSDGEAEGQAYQGYQLLPQDPETQEVESTISEENTSDSVVASSQENIQPGGSEECKDYGDGASAFVEQRIKFKVSRLGDEQVELALKRTIESDNGLFPQGASTKENKKPQRTAEAQERRELWDTVESRECEPMAKDQADKIMAAMAGFTLPSANTPSWAKAVPEDEWKSKLFSKLGRKPPTQHTSVTPPRTDNDTQSDSFEIDSSQKFKDGNR